MSYSSGLTRSDHQPSMSQLESSIQNARRDKRWVDASMDLERWLAASKAAYLAETAELPQMVSPSGGLVGKFFATKQTRQARGTSFTNDEEELRKILPKAQKVIDKQCASDKVPAEHVSFLSFVNKHNEHGKVQARLLIVTGAALYNFDSGGAKLKRRITLTSVGSVSANEGSGQFVLHVPKEYDYHFSVPSRGYAVGGDEQAGLSATPLAGMIVALQQAYASTMGGSPDSPNLLAVRNITSDADLSRYVQKKGQGGEDGVRWTGANENVHDDSDGD